MKGSPEPPLPYLLERAFPKLQFSEPVALVRAPGTERLFVVQLRGRIVSFADSQDATTMDLLVDLKVLYPELTAVYGLVFHPKFQENGFVYICYVLRDGSPDGTRVSRFTLARSNPPRLDPKSELVLLTFLAGGHNGGDLQFGRDGYLYISTGDGKGPYPPDPLDTGQDLSDLLSSILRIDVDHADGTRPYRVPPDNPFVQHPGARPEIWCYGLRNPWRMSFDERSGDLWIGDVGWETWEMIYRAQRGANYGWSYIEGKFLVKPDGKIGPTPIIAPTVMHHHSEAACIIGGYVYWGKRLPELEGAYIYGDYMTGRLWAIRQREGKVKWQRELANSAGPLVAFGPDRQNELYLVNFGGTLHRLVPNPAVGAPSDFPRLLSQTGLFTRTPEHELAPGVVSFAVTAAQWSDGALAERFIALPGDTTVGTTNGPWQFPTNTVVGKTLSLQPEPDRPARRRRVETQLLHFDGTTWNAYSFGWNEAQTDAELVDKSGDEQNFMWPDPLAPGGRHRQTWRFYSRSECLRCHNSAAGSVLGFTALQLKCDVRLPANHNPAVPIDQMALLAAQGVLDRLPIVTNLARLTDPRDPTASLDRRARSYLHANCSHCHREHAEGLVHLLMNYELPLEQMGLVGAKPTQGDFAIADARVVAPGDPERSVLYYRMAKLGRGRMPFIGSTAVDVEGLALLHDWIEQLRPPATPDAEQERRAAAIRRQQAAWLAQCSAPGAAAAEASIDRLLNSVSGALRLVRALDRGSLTPACRAGLLTKAAVHPSPLARELFERWIPEEQRLHTLGADIKPETILSLQGNAARGRDLFFREGGAQCHLCHRAGGEGRDFGPDLSHIASKYSRPQILENVLEPSKTIDPKYFGFLVETKSGEAYTGLVVRRTDVELVVKEITGRLVTLPLSQVATNQQLQLSLMPEQLLQGLTAQQAADLLEFLQSNR